MTCWLSRMQYLDVLLLFFFFPLKNCMRWNINFRSTFKMLLSKVVFMFGLQPCLTVFIFNVLIFRMLLTKVVFMFERIIKGVKWSNYVVWYIHCKTIQGELFGLLKFGPGHVVAGMDSINMMGQASYNGSLGGEVIV